MVELCVCVLVMWRVLLIECFSMLFIYNQFIISLSAAENKLTVLALQQDETKCTFTSEISDHDLQQGLCY